jgi:hypothetical protein
MSPLPSLPRYCGKVAYASRREAERAADSLRRRKRDLGLHTYWCRTCSAWHFGHDRKREQSRRPPWS